MQTNEMPLSAVSRLDELEFSQMSNSLGRGSIFQRLKWRFYYDLLKALDYISSKSDECCVHLLVKLRLLFWTTQETASDTDCLMKNESGLSKEEAGKHAKAIGSFFSPSESVPDALEPKFPDDFLAPIVGTRSKSKAARSKKPKAISSKSTQPSSARNARRNKATPTRSSR